MSEGTKFSEDEMKQISELQQNYLSLQNALGRALSLGRVGAMMTPVGMGITALGIGKSLYNIAQEEQDRINEMRENDPMAYQEYLAEQQELMDVSA